MKKLIICIVACLFALGADAQSDRQYIREGNRHFRTQDYVKAEVAYRKALAKNSRNAQAMYNLGCALMAQQKDSAAIVQYENAGKAETIKMRKAKVYHNIGWICQKHQMYNEAIEAYQESLRNNPNDDETRYNLALCKRQQKNQGKGNGKDNKNEKNNNKDKQDKQNKQNKQDKNKENDKQQKPDEKMSKDNAERLLNAAVQQEKATQQRLKKAMTQPQSKRLQKGW